MYEKLLSEGKIGNVTLKNRVIMTAMGVDCAEVDGSAGQRVSDYYEERAKGGVGLIITEVTRVNNYHGLALGGQLSMASDDMIEPFSKLVDKVHSHGTKIFVQLHHPGRQNLSALAYSWNLLTKVGKVVPHFWDITFKMGSYFDTAMLEDPRMVKMMKFMPPVVSAGNIPTDLGASIIRHQPTRALTIPEIHRLEKQFIAAAKRVQKAGGDGVELHAAHGYLIQQFLSPYTNNRKDIYGGSLDNRMRFLLNILTGIKKECGPDFPVSVRLSVEEYYDMLGYPNRGIKLPEGIEMAKKVEAAGADLINVSCGTYETLNTIIETMSFQPGWRTNLAKAVKDVVSIPVCGVGVIRTPEQAEELLESGNQDFIGLGRPLLADPHWVEKAEAGRPQDIQRCISCVTCFETDEANALKGEPCECAMNPYCCREIQYNENTIKKNGNGLTVAVVGAGPAGLTAAREAAKRGFKTVLFEKENEPGGQLNLAKMPPNKDRMQWAIDDLTQGAKNAGAEIRLGTAATEENLKALKPYAVILASGGTPIVPKIPGLDGDNVCTVADVLSGKVNIEGKKVAVIGSGLTGLETAELLVEKGNMVTVVEMADKIGPGIWTQHYWDIVPNLDKAGVNLLPSHKLTRVSDESVFLETADGNLKIIDVDCVVLSLGVRSVKDLEATAKSIADKVIAIGDADKPGKIVHATRAGLEAAWAL
ncbi:MAG: NAD(P)/FAD-dependent oxidoreductase [Eubacteriales bacterium]|nr:NAD(P)/FAD-dependent oxidoreductase [Eubacteriales bacterium]